MITLEQLRTTFGEDGEKQFEYLRNKNKGGVNNSKGNTFENFYTVYQIVKAFNDSPKWDNCRFSSQVFCYIDDLVIEEEEDKINRYYQIKDVADLGWSNGAHTIKEDFRKQHKLSRDLGVEPFLRLVVSRKEVYDYLVANLPEEIKDLVKVVHFETASSLNNLIRKNSLIKEELVKMCALKNPSADKLDALGTILLGSWDSTDKNKVPLKELLDKSYAQNPHFIRGLSTGISQRLSGILNSIEGFSYTIENGFLKWNFNTTDEGVLEYRIGSIEFEQWENDLFNAIIKTFEDLEPFLAS